MRKAKRYGTLGDWIPASVVDGLQHPNPFFRLIAERDAHRLGAEIIYQGYRAALLRIIPQTLPPGVPHVHPRTYLSPYAPNVTDRWNWDRRALEALGTQRATIDADKAREYCIDAWATFIAPSVCAGTEIDPVWAWAIALDALDEVKDAPLPAATARFWAMCQGYKDPPSFARLAELVRECPQLPVIGLDAVVAKGYVPPTWFTAAIT